MARKAMPTHLKVMNGKSNMTKAEIEKRSRAEDAMKPKADKIKPPRWLCKEGRKEWRVVAPELERLGLLTNIDVSTLAVYCDAVARYAEATKAIQENGPVMKYTNTAGETNSIRSPWVQIANQYATIIRQYLSEFGLSPSARASLAIKTEVPEEKSDFDRMFGSV